MSTLDYLAGRKLLEEVNSPVNGKITVVREVGWGTHINAGGLPQSGGLAKRIWEKSLKSVKRLEYGPKTVVVLGFAGGGIAHVARDYWPECEIYGVDIDKHMIDLGKKYLHWEKTGAHVWVQDAAEFMRDISGGKKPRGEFFRNSLFPKQKNRAPKKYDLVCVDMYIGSGVPDQFNTVSFVRSVEKIIAKDGVAVFNRLYGANDTGLAEKFKAALDKVFPDIDTVYPDANVMFLCKN